MKKIIIIFFFLNVALVGYTQRNVSVREAVSAAACKLKCMYDHPDTRVVRVNTSLDEEGNVLLYEVVFRGHYNVLLSGCRAAVPVLGVYNSSDVSILDSGGIVPAGLHNAVDGYKHYVSDCFDRNPQLTYSRQWDSLINGLMTSGIASTHTFLVSSSWGESVSNDGLSPNAYNYFLTEINGCKPPVGSAAVAMGQIMYYWQYPFFCVNGAPMPDWCNMGDALETGSSCFEINRDAIGRLLQKCGNTTQTEYSCDHSYATPSNFLTAMQGVWGFHTSSEFENVIGEPFPPAPGSPDPVYDAYLAALALYRAFTDRIKDNLDQGKPIILYDDNYHYCICDGYYTDGDLLLHINWGEANDNLNGFYRINNLDRFSILMDIYPMVDYHNSSDVNLSTYYANYLDELDGIYPYHIVPFTGNRLYSAVLSDDLSWRTIPAGATAVYQAHEEVILQDGFEAEAGCEFEARIEPCALCDEAGNNMQGANLPEGMASVGDQPDTTGGTVAYAVGQPQELPSDALFPNPTDGPLTMATDGMAQAVLVYTLSGNPVGGWRIVALTETSLSLDVSALAPGTYLLSVASPTGTRTAKFIRR